MSTETTTTTETAQQELREIALLLREYADAEDTSLAKLIEQHPGLGSDKTFGSICKGQFEEISVPKWLAAYRAVRDELSDTGEADPLYDDLSTTRRVRTAITRLKLSRTKAKLVIVKGYTGSGKTSALAIILQKYNAMSPTRQVYSTEASAGWGDSPTVMLGALLVTLGLEEGPQNKARRLKRLTTALQERAVMITIDEVHDLGVKCLRVLKTLLNETSVKIVIACHPRLWRQLESDAADDLSQLTGNRLVAALDLGTLTVEDVEIMLSRRLPMAGLNDDLKQAATIVAEGALNHGNLAFVRELIVRLAKQAGRNKTGKHPTLADVITAVTKEQNARKPEKTKSA